MESIKVVNNEILMADFGKVGMKALEELSCIKLVEADFVVITKDGKYLLNSANEYSYKYIPVLKIISVFPNRLLNSMRGFCSFIKVYAPQLNLKNKQIIANVKENKLNWVKSVYDMVCRWEDSRRKFAKKGG